MPKLTRTIVLIGFMGSGKSHVARLISKHTNAAVIDLDARIEAVCETSIATFFATHGEKRFREKESQALQQVLGETAQTPAVIATGGGVVTNEENRTLLQTAAQEGALVVYLRATHETLAARIRQEPGKRPLIDGEKILDMEQTQERVKILLESRRVFYESSANVIVDTDHNDAAQVAAEIIEQLI